jgi:hypothetical protein
MNKTRHLQPLFVEEMPPELSDGVLYIAKRFNTASHKCCCGCGSRVVTPLNPAKWRLIEHNGAVSLMPSIGNWSLPCRSHYWIERNHVRWAGDMKAWQVRNVRARDQRAAQSWAGEIPAPSTSMSAKPASSSRPTLLQWFVKWLTKD